MAQRNNATTDSKPVPGPSETGLLRHAVRLFRNDTSTMLQDLRERYGRIVRLRMPTDGTEAYLLADPAYVKHVLESNQGNYRKAAVYRDELGELFGRGLLTSEGDHWRRQHRTIRPMFRSDSVRSFADLVVEETDSMLNRWEEHAVHDEPIDLLPEMERVTLLIIGKAMFSADMETHAEDIAEALDVLRTEFQHQTNSIRPTTPDWLPTPHNRRVSAARDRLNAIVYDLIKERRGRVEEYDDLLSALVTARDEETGERMDDEQIRDELMTFLLAGHETTAAALTWTWYLLARNPAIHEELHKRVTTESNGTGAAVFSFGGDDPTYTKQCVQEAMRVYPPVPVFVREACETDTIDGYEIPAGSEVLLSQFVIHRDPELWDDPSEFRPVRFATGADESRARYSYFPFGGGARMCIGRQFALMEAQIVLSYAVKRHRLELESPTIEPGVDSAVTMVPDEPIKMSVTEW